MNSADLAVAAVAAPAVKREALVVAAAASWKPTFAAATRFDIAGAVVPEKAGLPKATNAGAVDVAEKNVAQISRGSVAP